MDVGVEHDLDHIARFLARRDVPELTVRELRVPADVVVLAGTSVLAATEVVAAALREGVAPMVLIAGGVGHSTPHLIAAIRSHPTYRAIATADRSEAAILADVLSGYLGIDRAAFLIEDRSTNCGENAAFSRDVLDANGIGSRSLVLVQDPTMQRRTHAAFERAWSDRPTTRIVSFAPFVPQARHGVVSADGRPPAVWAYDRFVSLVLGEIRRLRDDEHGYGPNGANFLDHVDLPSGVQAAHERLVSAFPDAVRPAGG
ncbi:MAG: hypothetical protein QOJ62_456 [Actinomycetota bacterium]|jgi:hypothetical protein|nr:hypothetical protein [Actinomycetota bacterium]